VAIGEFAGIEEGAGRWQGARRLVRFAKTNMAAGGKGFPVSARWGLINDCVCGVCPMGGLLRQGKGKGKAIAKAKTRLSSEGKSVGPIGVMVMTTSSKLIEPVGGERTRWEGLELTLFRSRTGWASGLFGRVGINPGSLC